MNRKIETLIEKEQWEQAWDAITDYEAAHPEDADINVYKCLCAMYIGEYEAAYRYAKAAAKDMPYSPDAHYNYACACQVCGKIYDAYEQYGIALEQALGGNNYQFDVSDLEQSMDDLLKLIYMDTEKAQGETAKEKKQYVDYLLEKSGMKWEVGTSLFHSDYEIISSEYMDYRHLPKLYVAPASAEAGWRLMCGSYSRTTRYSRAELQRSEREMNHLEIKSEKDVFLPILMEEDGYLSFEMDDKKALILNKQPMQYINYRIPKGKFSVSSERRFRIGTAIPIEHHPKRKRLVLNIFIDGLSQSVLGREFAELMPNTYKFFKKGMVCVNGFTAGDWTFPSIASIVTGQSAAKHKMLHSKLFRKLDADTPILFEYFKEVGYNTAKIGGNWRITPNYGYARGINRTLYQHHYSGYFAEDIIADTVEQMYSMRETDQFIWMEIGDLHMVADGINLGFHVSEFPLWENQQEQKRINSVKQDYNGDMIRYYKKEMERVDRKLSSLYQYIENNYKEDEMLVSLFADHGQGFLIPPGQEFLSRGRSNVALMVRGCEAAGVTEEIISTCDYAPMMCHLAGIPFSFENTDAHLPLCFGGDKEREFAVTESIHVGDPYQAALKGKDFTFYFTSEELVTSECRIPLKKYKVKLENNHGEEIENAELKMRLTEYCLKHISPCVIYDNET